MDRLNEILHELGISKVKLAKFLGVSRQMIYNYLEFDSINKWPKDKKVLLLNLLGIKSVEELDNIKVDTDYIYEVDARISTLCAKENLDRIEGAGNSDGLAKKQKRLFLDIMAIIKDYLEDENDEESYNTMLYLHHFLQSIGTSKELKYMLGYVSKATGYSKPLEFVFNEDDQFIFESILFSAISLYNGGGASKTKIAASHERFLAQIENKMEEKLSRTMELNSIKAQALKELGYTSINDVNIGEIWEKIAEIESRKVSN